MRAWIHVCLVELVGIALTSHAQTNETTAGYANYRTNVNLQETQLTPASVAPGNFGKLGARTRRRADLYSPAIARIGGQLAPIADAASVAGSPEGVLQLDIMVPERVLANPAQLTIEGGGVTSQSGVTVAIRP